MTDEKDLFKIESELYCNSVAYRSDLQGWWHKIIGRGVLFGECLPDFVIAAAEVLSEK